jgi:hypothetical protein
MKRNSNNPLKNPGRPENWFFQFLIASCVVSAGYTYITKNKQVGIFGGLAGVSTVLFIYRLSVRDYKEWLFWERVDLRRTRVEKNGKTFNGPKTWHDWNGLKGGHRPPFN